MHVENSKISRSSFAPSRWKDLNSLRWMRRHSTWWPLLTLVLLSLIFLLRSVLVGLSAPQHRINQSHVLLAPSIHRREANPSLPAWTAGEDTFAMERTSRNPLVSVRHSFPRIFCSSAFLCTIDSRSRSRSNKCQGVVDFISRKDSDAQKKYLPRNEEVHKYIR